MKKKLSCNCDCHTAEPVAVEEPAAPKAKSTGKAKKLAKGKSQAQIKHQERFGLVAKLKKQSPEMTNEQRWAKARSDIP